MPPRKKAARKKRATPGSVGFTAAETLRAASPELDRLADEMAADGGAVIGRYSEPFGGTPLLLVALPVDRVEPTPYQRDPSDAHVKRLMGVIATIGRFLDSIVVIREDGQYLTPNGTAFLTLGICYEERPRLGGGAYQPILRRVDTFLDDPIPT